MIILLLFISNIISLNLIFITSLMLATSPQLLIALSCGYVVFTLLTAGAAHIQNNVFLGVNSDKVSALKGQVARWKINAQERMGEKRWQSRMILH